MPRFSGPRIGLTLANAPIGVSVCRLLVFMVLAFPGAAFAGSHYLYAVDTSASMKSHRLSLLELVSLDMRHALSGDNPLYREGDEILLWSFNLDVREQLKFDFKAGSEKDLRPRIVSALNRLKMDGRTSLTKPLAKALEQFGPGDSENVSIVLYTDGKDTLSKREADYIVRLYKQYYQPASRLSNLILVRFGNRGLAGEYTNLLAALGGKVVNAGEPLELKPNRPPPAIERPPEVKLPTAISVSPKAIRWSSALSSEIVKTIPIEFKADPPQPGLLVRLSLGTTGLPAGMTMTMASDRLATEGKQAVSFVISGGQTGHFTAQLNLSAPVPIEPAVIPVDLEIVSSAPDRIGLQFFSESNTPATLLANGQWQKIQSAGLSLFYPDRLRDTILHFEGELPAGVEAQALAGGDPTKAIDLRKAVTLAALGRVVGFQLRQASPDVIGKNLTAKIAARLQPGQNVQTEGTDNLAIALQFVSAGEVRIETNEISLGQVLRGTKNVQRTLTLQVKGEAAGKKLRLVKQGQGLAGILITPSEILLKSGATSVDLEFSGFGDRAPGAIDGAFALVPEEAAAVDLRGGPVVVRGTIPAPGSIVAEVENSMVVGQPFYIHAKLDTHTNSSFRALVRPPNSGKDYEVALSDSGSAEDGDAKPNDGIYSGAFKGTEVLGKYRVSISGTGTKESGQTVSLNVPLYFRAQTEPLIGRLAQRGQGAYLHFKSKITSDYPGTIALHLEPGEPGPPLAPYVSTKSLEPGENTIDLVVGLTSETQATEYKFKAYLVTDKIGESRARIPIAFEITVVSLFEYLVRLLSMTLAIAGLVFLAVNLPWKKLGWLRGQRRAGRPATSPEDANDTFA